MVNKGGTDYFQFLLDLGEPGNPGNNSAQLLLQTFNLYTGNNDAPTFAEIGGIPDNLGTSRFKFATGNTVMLLDENSGNGQADVLIFVPFAAFAGVTDTYLYLYSEFGIKGEGNPTGAAEGTFEEFSALQGPRPPTVPDSGSTLAFFGGAMGMADLLRRFISRRAKNAGVIFGAGMTHRAGARGSG